MFSLLTILSCLGAFVAGFVDAIAGGGGVITLPILFLLGLPVDLALGTNKLISSSGTLLSSLNYIRQKKYSDFVVKYNLVLTCLGAALGAFSISLVNPVFLKPLVSVLVISIALYLFFKPKYGTQKQVAIYTRSRINLSILAAFLLGFYDGIFGPGTGAFLTFMFLRLFKQEFLLATGNTKILNLASNIVALTIFVVLQKIDWTIGIPMAIANMLGGYFGSQLAIKRGSSWIRWIFIVMAIVVGIRQLV
jgi:uncharacterized membrane protein YfcA